MKLNVLYLIIFSTTICLANDIIVQSRKNDHAILQTKGFEQISRSHPAINSKYRDQFYMDTSLNIYIKKYDEVEKNILYLRLKKISPERLQKKYPAIPIDILIKAKNALEHQL